MGEGQHCAEQGGVALPQLKQTLLKLDIKSILLQLNVLKVEYFALKYFEPVSNQSLFS